MHEAFWTEAGSGTLTSMLEKRSWFHYDQSSDSGNSSVVTIDVKRIGLFLKKTFFKILELSFSTKLDLGFYIIFIGKAASK